MLTLSIRVRREIRDARPQYLPHSAGADRQCSVVLHARRPEPHDIDGVICWRLSHRPTAPSVEPQSSCRGRGSLAEVRYDPALRRATALVSFVGSTHENQSASRSRAIDDHRHRAHRSGPHYCPDNGFWISLRKRIEAVLTPDGEFAIAAATIRHPLLLPAA